MNRMNRCWGNSGDWSHGSNYLHGEATKKNVEEIYMNNWEIFQKMALLGIKVKFWREWYKERGGKSLRLYWVRKDRVPYVSTIIGTS